MPSYQSNPLAKSNPRESEPRSAQVERNTPKAKPNSVLDLLGPDDPLHQEMEQLLAENQHRTKAAAARNGSPSAAANAAGHRPAAAHAEPVPLSESEELAVLRGENLKLRTRVEELEQFLEATTNQTDQLWSEQQKEYEMLLEEKSEVIRALHKKLKEKREKPAAEPKSSEMTPEFAESSVAFQNELLAIKEQLEQDRKQLEEDERALMDQMREMEMAMSKERVEMARKLSELQRLHQDMQHEMEQAQKDGGLRERLMGLQRRAQGEAPPDQAGQPPPRRALPTQQNLPGAKPEPKQNRPSSGFLRRLFG